MLVCGQQVTASLAYDYCSTTPQAGAPDSTSDADALLHTQTLHVLVQRNHALITHATLLTSATGCQLKHWPCAVQHDAFATR